MVFLANCIRPVYVVRTEWRTALFHNPNDAQVEYRWAKLMGDNPTLTIETLKFEGWRVVG